MIITHSKVSAVADGADATQVQPSDWNDDHVISGGGLTLLGKTTVGGSFSTSSGDMMTYLKKITAPANGLLFPPSAYFKFVATPADVGFSSSFWLDDGVSGSASRPLRAFAGVGGAAAGTRLINTPGTEYWITVVGASPVWVTSGQIVWVAVGCHYQSPYVQLAYDESGEDLTGIFSGGSLMGETGLEGWDLDFTTTTRNHSIRVPFLAV